MTLISDVFPQTTDSKNVVRQMSRKLRFGVPFDKQHGKWVQNLFKSAPQDLYHIY